MRSLKKLTKNSIFFILAGLLTLLLMEGYIRYGEIQSLSNFEVDSVHGKRLRARVPMLYLMEGFYMGEVNEYGYLGPGYAPEKEHNTYRVALLGDSYVEGFQLFDRHHFRHILENSLQNKMAKTVEVLNFGRSGFTLADMYVYYKEFADQFEPDIYLVFVHNNDFFEQSYQALLPKVVIQQDSLVIKRPFIQNKAFHQYQKTAFFRENSTYLRMMNNGIKLIKEGVMPEILLGKFYNPGLKEGEGNTNQVAEESMPQMPEANKATLEAFAGDAKVIFVLGEKPQLEIAGFLKNSNALVIPIWEEFHAMREEGIYPNYWEATGKYGHWNQEAHKKLAEQISSELGKEKY